MSNTEALLEQVRRLERSGSAPGSEEAEGEASPSAPPSRQTALEERARPEEEVTPVSSRQSRTSRWSDTGPDGEKRLDAASQEAETEPEAALEPPERILTPLEKNEAEGSVLLEQLERLERAAEAGDSAAVRPAAWTGDSTAGRNAVSGTTDGGRRSAVYPDAAGAAGDGWTLEADFVRPDAQPAAELRWAEQADRAFRRDSRRYDGGFYLF